MNIEDHIQIDSKRVKTHLKSIRHKKIIQQWVRRSVMFCYKITAKGLRFSIIQMTLQEQWFFVALYVVMDKNKLTERDVDNDIPHWEGLGHVKNSLFRSRQSRDGTLNSRRVLTPQNLDIIVHIPWDELILYVTLYYATKNHFSLIASFVWTLESWNEFEVAWQIVILSFHEKDPPWSNLPWS